MAFLFTKKLFRKVQVGSLVWLCGLWLSAGLVGSSSLASSGNSCTGTFGPQRRDPIEVAEEKRGLDLREFEQILAAKSEAIVLALGPFFEGENRIYRVNVSLAELEARDPPLQILLFYQRNVQDLDTMPIIEFNDGQRYQLLVRPTARAAVQGDIYFDRWRREGGTGRAHRVTEQQQAERDNFLRLTLQLYESASDDRAAYLITMTSAAPAGNSSSR